MIASQVDETITNEDSYVVPFISGRMVGTMRDGSESLESINCGLLSVHNELGSNKSILLPLVAEIGIKTLTVLTKGETCDKFPTWLTHAITSSEPNTTKAVNKHFANIYAGMDDEDGLIDRAFQVNILAAKDDPEIFSSHPSQLIKRLSYEILTGDPSSGIAHYRKVVAAKDFIQNGHVIEALVSETLMVPWACKEFDMPYSLCRDLRWFGAQYLTKNTRGNLTPQLRPLFEQQRQQMEAEFMRDTNEEWGALSALSAIIRR